MGRTLKIVVFSVAGIAALVMVGGFVFYVQYRGMARELSATEIRPVDLGTVEDGTYTGEMHNFIVGADVRVTVRDHRIVSIEVLDQRAGPGHEAREIIDRVLQSQSLQVDAVTGATGSSIVLLKAVERALTQAP